jgi:hypothetical protein
LRISETKLLTFPANLLSLFRFALILSTTLLCIDAVDGILPLPPERLYTKYDAETAKSGMEKVFLIWSNCIPSPSIPR